MDMLFPFTDPVAAAATPPLTMVSGDGITVTDDRGKTYIDAASGLWCAGLGFSNQGLADAATAQLARLPFYHSFMHRSSDTVLRLADELRTLVPAPLETAFFSCSGSEAVDLAAKLVGYYFNALGQPNKKRIIARENGYHGSGFFSAALTGMAYCHDGFDTPTPLVIRAACPAFHLGGFPGETERDYALRLADELDRQIQAEGPETIGAFIGEPVIGSGGAFIPPDGYWPAVQRVLRKHEILLIADEVITGFGRTGRWFGSELYGIEPDMMTIAKQLSGAYVPISATVLSGPVHDVIAGAAHELGTFGHGITYGGHPVGAAVALEAIRQYREMDVCATVARLGERLRAGLEALAEDNRVDRIRSVGLIGAVDLTPRAAPGEAGNAVAQAAAEHGLLYRTVGDTVALAPPMVATLTDIDEILERLQQAITS